jgi:hypothetical protein
MIYFGTIVVVIFAALACYRKDERKRSRGESDRSGQPWNWEQWL